MRDLIRGLRNFWHDPAGRAVLGLAGTVVGTGTVFYRFVEDLKWIDSLYFCVITLTTVGYGDIAPSSSASKAFTIVLILMGIGILITFIERVARYATEDFNERRNKG